MEESGCPDWDMAQPTHPQNKNTQAGRMTRSVTIGSRQDVSLTSMACRFPPTYH